MSRVPRDWRKQPAPLMAYVSAAASFVIVAVGVGIVSAGTIMSLAGLKIAVSTTSLGWWLFVTPIIGIGLGGLSAYHAFQQARAARSGTLPRSIRRPLPWYRRTTFLLSLTALCGATIGWCLASPPVNLFLDRWSAGLVGAMAGGVLASLRLTYAHGLLPRSVTAARLKVLCPNCHQAILSGFETCPLCGARQTA